MPPRGGVEQVGVRFATGGHEQFVDHDRLLTAADLDAVGDPAYRGRCVSETHVDPLGEQLREAFRDVVVEAAQHGGRPREQRHLRTEAGEDVSHLGGDESTADDPEA